MGASNSLAPALARTPPRPRWVLLGFAAEMSSGMHGEALEWSVSRLRNEPVLFSQCSKFYKICFKNASVSCRLASRSSAWLLGASFYRPHRGSAPAPRWVIRTNPPNPLCPPYHQTLATLLVNASRVFLHRNLTLSLHSGLSMLNAATFILLLIDSVISHTVYRLSLIEKKELTIYSHRTLTSVVRNV